MVNPITRGTTTPTIKATGRESSTATRNIVAAVSLDRYAAAMARTKPKPACFRCHDLESRRPSPQLGHGKEPVSLTIASGIRRPQTGQFVGRISVAIRHSNDTVYRS